MGMFDTVRSTYDLGPGYLHKDLQTKDLECMMNEYWIDPNGHLYEIDYSGTADFVELQPGDDGYNDDRKYLNFVWVPNGARGKIRPVYVTKAVVVYPAKWDAYYAKWPSCIVTFVHGIIASVTHV